VASRPDTLLLPTPLSSLELAPSWPEPAVTQSTRDYDRAALAALYEQHAPSIHRFLCDLLGDGALAADGTQETFVRAFRRIAALDDRAHVGAWLFGIARNVARELRKARFRAGRTFVAEAAQTEPITPWHDSPEDELLDREALGVVGAALARLSEDRRAVLLLRLDHALAYEQIAETMGWSLAKVKVEIFRAREQLRAALQAYEGGAR
jgi:RNA polymerase sigma-70 factor, ECF subfamily